MCGKVARVLYLLEKRVRDTLFFLSLTMLLRLNGLLNMRLGSVVALAIFWLTFRGLLLRGRMDTLRLLTIVTISIVLVRGVMGLPFSHMLLVYITVLTVLQIYIYAKESSEVEVAPALMVFVAMLFILNTFVHIPIPDKISWAIVMFLTSCSMIDDWNVKHRPLEAHDEEHCFDE